ncbi:alpha/beta hydrolase [Planctomyces sp. SH-PL62]|uniref:alpha/beta hydrolase n=1 Tax=Planctomyces sp. SH-PL62 TaxID=1636152 RepID=UPI00078C8EC2|nr:alpha/beta fold hydrolase [Planctomyces sp. SH-PL62]AMV39535.1 Alpha/beta hydrolase family protein [Planctomyces sp. SH-PL62]
MMARPRIRLTRLALAGAGAMLLALTYLAISCVTAELLTRPTNHPLRIDPCRVSQDAEPWTTRTRDGLTLRGWRLVTGDPRRLIVLVHGMWSAWPEMAALGRDLHERGYDVLLFDLRGHGQSDSARLSLGSRERADLRAVLDWARGEGYEEDRIGWLGYSMGAATLVLEAAVNPAIRIAVLDSPYGDLPRLLEGQLSKHSRLPSWFNPGILACARLLYGLRTEDLVPIAAAAAWGDRPMLLIHGEADSTVPVAQARSLGRAVGAACLTAFLPGVEHVEAYRSDPRRYVALISRFFDDNLGP